MATLFERFSDEGRWILEGADTAATKLGVRHVGTEHILLAVIRHPGSPASNALAELGVSPAAVLTSLQALPAPRKGPGFTPRANRAIEDALSSAPPNARARAEHLLLGALADPRSTASRILRTLGIDRRALRRHIAELADDWRGHRVDSLSPEEAACTVAAFEHPLASLTQLAHEGGLSEWDEEFLRNTVQQIHLWRQRPDANPQIFELLVGDLVRRFIEPLTDPEPLRSQLVRLGADGEAADNISERVAETISAVAHVGGDDPEDDARLLAHIARATDRIATAVDRIASQEGEKTSLLQRAQDRAMDAAAGAVGAEVAGIALTQLKNVVDDHWSQIKLGLLIAWRSVRAWFVR